MKTEAEILEATDKFINFVESLTDEEIIAAGFCIVLHFSTNSITRVRVKGSQENINNAVAEIIETTLD